MIELLREKDGIVFPDDKIILLDGSKVDCFPRKEGCSCNVDYNIIELDTTGEYLTYGKGKSRSKDYIEDFELFCARQLFIENSFLLLHNRERILHDSRMFLAPVSVESGLAYTGTSGFRNPTIGVYLEWWTYCDGALMMDEEGVRSLVYRLAGSPLSGANRCTAVREDGKEETVTLRPFNDYWRSFMKINQRYSDAKSHYEAYSLQQVLDILKDKSS